MEQELFEFLEEKAEQYNRPDFIESDPISIPHQFSKKEDIEISAFLVATIAWGQRKTIINNGNKLMALMDHAPYDFVLNSTESELKNFATFKHRTFNALDLCTFIEALKNIYTNFNGLERCFSEGIKQEDQNLKSSIISFRERFFSIKHPTRSEKHVSNPAKGSSAKRLNMFLRWMVRQDNRGVDFGIWKRISPGFLSCPLDVHSGNVARKLGLLERKQNDWKAVEELDGSLREMDADDPVKYDFALFGLGVFEGFK